MIHDWFINYDEPVYNFAGLKISVEIFTDSNRYDIDPKNVSIVKNTNEMIIEANSLTWAAGQEKCSGYIKVNVKKEAKHFTFKAYAKHNELIRKLKIKLTDEHAGKVIGRRRYDYDIDYDGTIFRYPNGWDDLYTPLIIIKGKTGLRYYRSLDNILRPKQFVTRLTSDDLAVVEMIFEEDSRYLKNEMDVPIFEVGDILSIEEIYEAQKEFIEKSYQLEPWEKRTDIPSWARNISLVASIHGMHWSGYIFNDYQEIYAKLLWLKDYIDPSKVLVYIPGFDGRYYYKYPNYDPDIRMGGKEGLHQLIENAHRLGYHIMPMFMINGANPKTPGFNDFGESSRYHGPNGYVLGVGSCDWDTSRGYDLGCGVGLNPGAPKWQDYFVNEVIKQIDEYGFDAIFLDLAAIYHNDPYYSTHEGAIKIINRIHEKHPEILISTEGCYDALSKAFPFSQCAGEGSKGGEMIYHDTPYAPLFDTYNRMFGHLCLGDVTSGRNGVFEWGKNTAEKRLPLRKGIIQTLTILDDTLNNDTKEVLEVIKQANIYYDKYIKGEEK